MRNSLLRKQSLCCDVPHVPCSPRLARPLSRPHSCRGSSPRTLATPSRIHALEPQDVPPTPTRTTPFHTATSTCCARREHNRKAVSEHILRGKEVWVDDSPRAATSDDAMGLTFWDESLGRTEPAPTFVSFPGSGSCAGGAWIGGRARMDPAAHAERMAMLLRVEKGLEELEREQRRLEAHQKEVRTHAHAAWTHQQRRFRIKHFIEHGFKPQPDYSESARRVLQALEAMRLVNPTVRVLLVALFVSTPPKPRLLLPRQVEAEESGREVVARYRHKVPFLLQPREAPPNDHLHADRRCARRPPERQPSHPLPSPPALSSLVSGTAAGKLRLGPGRRSSKSVEVHLPCSARPITAPTRRSSSPTVDKAQPLRRCSRAEQVSKATAAHRKGSVRSS